METSRMLQKLDRAAIVIVCLAVGLQAIIPGWQIMTDGSVYGFKLPATWLTGAWPFSDYFVAGLLLLIVVGGGCLATVAITLFNPDAGWIAALVMGIVLVGWIIGELLFMTQTMIMTWMILGSGLVLIALSAPFAWPELRAVITRRTGRRAPA